MSGQVIGFAGRSLQDGSFLANKSTIGVGVEAEQRTAQVLQRWTLEGPSVAHDLNIPIKGIEANIDHVVVAGSTVLVIDSKWWSGNIFWTAAGVTRRGLEVFPPADKKTLPMACTALAGFFARNNVHDVNVVQPLMVVWGPGMRNTSFYRPAGARAIRGEALSYFLRTKSSKSSARADICMALASLIKI